VRDHQLAARQQVPLLINSGKGIGRQEEAEEAGEVLASKERQKYTEEAMRARRGYEHIMSIKKTSVIEMKYIMR
jgi:hypothetical protein